jgi:regulator of ribonuclease activity A
MRDLFKRKFMQFYTADICDHHSDQIQIADPILYSYGGVTTFHGQIHTIQLFEDNDDLVTLLRDVQGEGKVCVVDVQGDYCAVVGETLIGFAYKNGWAGIVINGYIRDAHATVKIPVGLVALGKYPFKSKKKKPGRQDIELNFAGVTFRPDNYLYADSDGMVVSSEPFNI